MNRRLFLSSLALAATLSVIPAEASTVTDLSSVTGGGGADLPPYLQCVPYARQLTGVQIFGDAHTWWGQAEGRYARGFRPRLGAVMALRPHGNSRLGHVAAVSRIVDSRTILVSHSNWSLINGRRGQIENNVRVVDVSDANDWSAVRVWNAPLHALGGTHWPVQGFIYNKHPSKGDAAIRPAPRSAQGAAPQPTNPAPARTVSSDPIGDIIAARLRR